MPCLRLALVGTGRAAAGLAPLFCSGGARLVAVVGRSREAARRVASLAPPAPGGGRADGGSAAGPPAALAFDDLPAGLAGLRPVGGWVLAVSDDAIAQVDERLARVGAYRGARWACHLSGALPAALLSAARGEGLAVASLHPLASFPPVPGAGARAGGASAPAGHPAASPPIFALEGDEAALADLERWLSTLGARWARIDPEAKPLYHAAASLAANLGLALVALAGEVAARAGLPRDEAERALAELAAGAMANAARLGPGDALTGPIRRGDVGTVRLHLRALSALPRRFLEVYATLGLEAVRLARRAADPPETLAEIEAELLRARDRAARPEAGRSDGSGGGSA